MTVPGLVRVTGFPYDTARTIFVLGVLSANRDAGADMDLFLNVGPAGCPLLGAKTRLTLH